MTLGALGFPLLRPLLHGLDAETAHRLTIRMLSMAPHGNPPACDPRLRVEAIGLSFPNPLGLAAGFDKNAEVPDAMLAEGMGFVEVGTVTPLFQSGNPKPRLFRLTEDRAVINRMGFNNEGHDAALRRLAARQGRSGIVGVNLGANKDSADRIADYVKGIETFSGHCSYLTINISSPNTPGLRSLQSRAELSELLSRLDDARQRSRKKTPMLLKIAPDLRGDELEDIAHCCGEGAVDGVIVSNTTIGRPMLRSDHAKEQGGLSGQPLFALSTRQLAKLRLMTEGRLLLVGAGGIGSPEQAWAKICAGASLLQLYSALVFEGPQLIRRILSGLVRELDKRPGFTLAQAVGSEAKSLAHQGDSGT